MKIGGFQKLSLLDYPGKLSAVVFTSGCNLRCPFCHNGALLTPSPKSTLYSEAIFSYLMKNRNMLNAVVVSGGEPTLQADLFDFISKLKDMEFLVKLDTNGTNPKIVEKLISDKLIDYIAMDVKAPLDFNKYNQLVGGVLTDEYFDNILESVLLLMDSDVDYEFRTTAIKGVHTKEDLKQILLQLKGAKRYYIQEFVPENALEAEWKSCDPFSKSEISAAVGPHIIYRS